MDGGFSVDVLDPRDNISLESGTLFKSGWVNIL